MRGGGSNRKLEVIAKWGAKCYLGEQIEAYLLVYHREGVGEMKVAHKILIRKCEVENITFFLFYLTTFLQVCVLFRVKFQSYCQTTILCFVDRPS
jgi:hypothetical protein